MNLRQYFQRILFQNNNLLCFPLYFLFHIGHREMFVRITTKMNGRFIDKFVDKS
jgi:hypothetical protein